MLLALYDDTIQQRKLYIALAIEQYKMRKREEKTLSTLYPLIYHYRSLTMSVKKRMKKEVAKIASMAK